MFIVETSVLDTIYRSRCSTLNRPRLNCCDYAPTAQCTINIALTLSIVTFMKVAGDLAPR